VVNKFWDILGVELFICGQRVMLGGVLKWLVVVIREELWILAGREKVATC